MKTGIIILRPIGSEMNKIVIDQTFGTAELLLFGSAQMTEPFSAEHRTFFFTIHWLSSQKDEILVEIISDKSTVNFCNCFVS